jgi:hypothetical protein
VVGDSRDGSVLLSPDTSRVLHVRRTLSISCEAVTPPVCPAGAQGGTLYARPGAALSFDSCIALFGGSPLPLQHERVYEVAEQDRKARPAHEERHGFEPRAAPPTSPRRGYDGTAGRTRQESR